MVNTTEMILESTHTRLESLLQRTFETKRSQLHISGGSSLLTLAFFLSQSNSKAINNLPHLIILPSLADCYKFQQHLEFFDPQRQSSILPEFDVFPYEGLSPSPNISFDRLNFLSAAVETSQGQIFLASAQGLGQRTLPYSLFIEKTLRLSVGDELPENIHRFLIELGYEASPLVEDRGQFAYRGGILDIFSPSGVVPIRIELFGDQIESLRTFSVADQRSLDTVKSFLLIPAREVLYLDNEYESCVKKFRDSLAGRPVDSFEREELLRQVIQKTYFPGVEFLLPFFYKNPAWPIEFFSTPLNVWVLDPAHLTQTNDSFFAELKTSYENSLSSPLRPAMEDFFLPLEKISLPEGGRKIEFSDLDFLDENKTAESHIHYRTLSTTDLSHLTLSSSFGSETWLTSVKTKLLAWKEHPYRIFIAIKSSSQIERLRLLLERMDFRVAKTEVADFRWDSWLIEQDADPSLIHLIPRHLSESLRLDEERVIFLNESDFFGKKDRLRERKASDDFQSQAKRLSFGDLKPGDLVVHVKHGIGQYEGLKVMPISGVENEFIQLSYKDKDRLYLPVYRVGQLQKYAGANATIALDRLGGPGWEKAKSKVKSHLKEVAHDLLMLYAKRAELHRPAFLVPQADMLKFESAFPYVETEDQIRAINDLTKDLLSTKPMDRLICGDVGFGKTEVAMRAAFIAVQNQKQVAILAPTTVLTFQHVETLRKRFSSWPINIAVLNRFVSTVEAKKTLVGLKDGRVNILIGTHRLLSKDIVFNNLGLLIIDEEQKFGVTHKEKIKKLKTSVDTLTLSATPIPRTLNMSLYGVRDLSLINTAPVDRLPTRTFICKFDPEAIRKAITSEIHRGGQVYFIHNRVQSIYGLADEIRQIVPEARIKVAHGQMEEEELEKTMLAFFHHEIDVLICTAIVESGMDVSRANTMFIDQAQLFGVSQLYQLRGRVGRSKQRAYCYLILPRQKKLDKETLERLKIIQENTALGSGIKIAQYDLELRGAGNILGEEQSGHISSVGYELYTDLLNEALHEIRGEPTEDYDLDPEINLRVPAMIPESYIADIRIRLSYYKALAEIKSESDLEKIEDELKDQFGPIPDPIINLMGLMLIRRQCKDLGVRDISAGAKTISLVFTEKTKLKTETVVQLASRENKKYSITPDNRLNVRMNNITWSSVYEEMNYLLKLI